MLATTGILRSHAQGTIAFNGHPYFSGTDYDELGMWFQVVIPPGTSGVDVMGITLGADNTPRNGTAFMDWFRQYNPRDYVELHLTNGGTFGLTSVQLAGPNSPSLSPVPITFKGYQTDGVVVSQTFTTPGNGATGFLNYRFDSAFASGLTLVEIQSTRWAMDNLVFIPEPGSATLVLLGLVPLALRKRRAR